MSVSSEKSESKTRVTRSMRRLNSESESIDLENRPETPTNRARKKLDHVDTPTLTPSKRTTRASSAQRNLIEEVVASPIRRTRRTSTDRPVDSPLKMTRSMRLSNQNLNESEDEEPATPRILKTARVTLVKLEEVVEEEPEAKLNTSGNINELELRNRSVSKSPADAPLNKSVNNRVSLSDEIKAAEKQNGRHEIFDLNDGDEENQHDSITEELAAPEEENEEQETSIHDTSKVEEHEVSIMQENIETAPANDQSQIESMEVDTSLLTTTQYGDLTDTPLRVEARMTQYEVVDSMMDDFVPETAETENEEAEQGADDNNEVFEEEPENKEIEQIVEENEEIEQNFEETVIEPENEEIKQKIEQIIEDNDTSTMDKNDTSAVGEENVQKSPSKRTSSSWSTAVVGSTADRIDTFVAPTTEEPIVAPEISPKKVSKLIDTDESEDDSHEKNSLIDDEAEEAGSDEESMTKSERDELELNEIVDEGESLGSEDSNANEIDSENEDEDDDDYDSKDSFLCDDENVENQYEMGESEEEVEEISEKKKKRRSRIIEESSSEDEGETEPQESPKEQSSPEQPTEESPEQPKGESPEKSPAKSSPQKSPSKSPKIQLEDATKSAILEELKQPNAATSRRSLPLRADTSIKKRNSIPSTWTVEDVENNQVEAENSNDRKRKRESVIHGTAPKRFREMSPNESEAVHMENVEEIVEEVPSSSKKAKKSKEKESPVDLDKILERCEEHLEKVNQEKKSKVALKRKKQEEKKAKKIAQGESLEASPGSDDKENSGEKKKKKKHKVKKQPLLAEIEEPKDDMAAKLSKHQEKLEQKREKKRKKKEIKIQTVDSSGNEISMTEQPVVVKKKKPKATLDTSNVFNDTTQSTSEAAREKKTKKRRIEETLASNDDTDIIERPKAKKKLNILQQVEDPSQMPRNHQGTSKSAKENEVGLQGVTVSSKLKSVMPKALDKKPEKKIAKKKGTIKTIPEPRKSLPRPVWTSAGTFIEESIEPYNFKSTEYKPINAAGTSSQFRVIPFEARSKKFASKSTKMELLMKRGKAGRDKTMRNMKNLM